MNLMIQAGEGLLNCAQDTDLLLIGGVRSLARVKDIPGGVAAFGRGFVGIDDSRQPNNNHSTRGAQLG
eukprot:SAG22_NODE_104_length_20159_cov_5.877517_8_plen_68_part_00